MTINNNPSYLCPNWNTAQVIPFQPPHINPFPFSSLSKNCGFCVSRSPLAVLEAGMASVPPRGSHWTRRPGRSPPGWICGGHGWWVGGQGWADKEPRYLQRGEGRSRCPCGAGAALGTSEGLRDPPSSFPGMNPSTWHQRFHWELARLPASPLALQGNWVGAPQGWDEEPDPRSSPSRKGSA